MAPSPSDKKRHSFFQNRLSSILKPLDPPRRNIETSVAAVRRGVIVNSQSPTLSATRIFSGREGADIERVDKLRNRLRDLRRSSSDYLSIHEEFFLALEVAVLRHKPNNPEAFVGLLCYNSSCAAEIDSMKSPHTAHRLRKTADPASFASPDRFASETFTGHGAPVSLTDAVDIDEGEWKLHKHKRKKYALRREIQELREKLKEAYEIAERAKEETLLPRDNLGKEEPWLGNEIVRHGEFSGRVSKPASTLEGLHSLGGSGSTLPSVSENAESVPDEAALAQTEGKSPTSRRTRKTFQFGIDVAASMNSTAAQSEATKAGTQPTVLTPGGAFANKKREPLSSLLVNGTETGSRNDLVHGGNDGSSDKQADVHNMNNILPAPSRGRRRREAILDPNSTVRDGGWGGDPPEDNNAGPVESDKLTFNRSSPHHSDAGSAQIAKFQANPLVPDLVVQKQRSHLDIGEFSPPITPTQDINLEDRLIGGMSPPSKDKRKKPKDAVIIDPQSDQSDESDGLERSASQLTEGLVSRKNQEEKSITDRLLSGDGPPARSRGSPDPPALPDYHPEPAGPSLADRLLSGDGPPARSRGSPDPPEDPDYQPPPAPGGRRRRPGLDMGPQPQKFLGDDEDPPRPPPLKREPSPRGPLSPTNSQRSLLMSPRSLARQNALQDLIVAKAARTHGYVVSQGTAPDAVADGTHLSVASSVTSYGTPPAAPRVGGKMWGSGSDLSELLSMGVSTPKVETKMWADSPPESPR